MLKDLINDLKSEQDSKPQNQLELLITTWYEEDGSLEDKQVIYDFAKDRNLLFMIPSDWFDDNRLNKALEDPKDEVNHSSVILNLKASSDTAKVVKKFVDFLLSCSKKEDEDFSIVFKSGDDSIKQIDVNTDDISLSLEEERYEGQDSDLEKALYIETSQPDSIHLLEDVLDAAKENDKLILDDDTIIDTSDVLDLKSEVSDNKLIVEASPKTLSQLEHLFTTIAELGNGGHSFSIVTSDTDQVYWDGDGSDYVRRVDLVKASQTPFAQELARFKAAAVAGDQFSQSRTAINMLQQELAPYGVIVETTNSGDVVLAFQEGPIRDVVRDKLQNLGLDEFIREVAFDDVKGTTIVLVILSLSVEDQSIEKARKGTDGYDKWLVSYREKRKSKQKKLEETPEDGISQEKLRHMSLEDQISALLSERKKHSLAEDLDFQLRRQENEEKLEHMFTLFQKKRK